MKYHASNITDLRDLKFSLLNESKNHRLTIDINIVNTTFYDIVDTFSRIFILHQSKPKNFSKTKHFKLQIIGFDANDNRFVIESSNSISAYDAPQKVFAFFGIALQEMLYPFNKDFFINLLKDERKYYLKNNFHLPHAIQFLGKHVDNVDFNSDDDFNLEQVIRAMNSSISSNNRYNQNIESMQSKLDITISKSNINDLINLIFGNYTDINNIHACTRLYVLGQNILNLQS